MGNNTSINVLIIGTDKLVMWKGYTLYLHDVFYASKVREILFMLLLCYNWALK